MVKRIDKYRLLLLFPLLLCTCSEFEFPEQPETPLPQADADFSNIVFIGGSRFSGVEDGALSSQGYEFSVPNLFLKELGFTDREEVIAPRIISENGFNIYTNPDQNGSDGAFRLFFPQDDTIFFKRDVKEGTPLVYENEGSDQLQAFTFPKANSLDFTEAGRSVNPYALSFFDNSISLVSRARATNPSFFILDLGFDDIFEYAQNGTTGDPEINDANSFSTGDLLSENLFRAKVQTVVDEMLSAGPDTKGLIFNVPDIFKYPYFVLMPTSINNHVRSKPSIRLDARIPAISFNNSIFDYYASNPVMNENDRRPLLDFGGSVDADRWGLVVEDETLVEIIQNGVPIPKVKQLKLLDFVFYQKEQQLWSGYGSLVENPIPESGYLDEDEALLIQDKIDIYNSVISDAVENSGGRLGLVDIHAFFEEMFIGYSRLLGNPTEGLNIDGVRLEPLISRDGIFSADGINMNPVGNVVITNRIIDAINAHFGGNLRRLDPNNVPNTRFDIGSN